MTEDEFVQSQCGAPACADRRGSLARGGDALLACVPHGGAAHYLRAYRMVELRTTCVRTAWRSCAQWQNVADGARPKHADWVYGPRLGGVG
jgi:hypothetical protein